ncbi:MAG TPA: ATP-dependent DNA helicase [Candidatus Nanoperiomorbaceae bacterium]|nr:ATP-dependent DNA helicase [Candidatus Nanoperiomorbaceae bacterium]
MSLPTLWADLGFTPNPAQDQAIRHIKGPLYLPAGPGSGKTRVLLWRTVNLIVFHGVQPDEIFLSTFTEKAALQLKEGLRGLLAVASRHTGQHYDLAGLYVGTVHSLCRRLLLDRRLHPQRQRGQVPALRDELSQYLSLYRPARWTALTESLGLTNHLIELLNELFIDKPFTSRHLAVTHCLTLFNRLSEECLDPKILGKTVIGNPILNAACLLYQNYRQRLSADQATDLSLLQQHALDLLNSHAGAGAIFHHVIIDEYQDTNTIQERLFFALANGHRNLCVVGDDDQALYRFRGATVENFVEFADRCQQYWALKPNEIPLLTNYRSREPIVKFYQRFIEHHNWRKDTGAGLYRVPKTIQPHHQGPAPAVVLSEGAPATVCAEVAEAVKTLIDTGKVQNPNQIAFLFPSLKSTWGGTFTKNKAVERMETALEAVGLKVYAPRAGRFLEVDEAVDLLGIYVVLLGKPRSTGEEKGGWGAFHEWLKRLKDRGEALLKADPHLLHFIADRQAEMKQALADEDALLAVMEQHGWDGDVPYDIAAMKRPLLAAQGLSERARNALNSMAFENAVKARQKADQPLALREVIARATALDWSLLDLFWRLTGFEHFKAMFDAAQAGADEGPLCNLGLLSQYLARFIEEYRAPLVTAGWVRENRLRNSLIGSYLYALFRRGEAEYEDADDPFPKGRIPFLTIHQAKGLEFPVVVLGTLDKRDFGPQKVETLLHPYLPPGGEPLERMSQFDIMRLFYVALSRPQQLLILARHTGRGLQTFTAFNGLTDTLPKLSSLNLATVPEAEAKKDDVPQTYSYTGDYLAYQRCPRQYMVFHRYGLEPSRSQTMLFGNLVHRTLEDLHQYLIAERENGA